MKKLILIFSALLAVVLFTAADTGRPAKNGPLAPEDEIMAQPTLVYLGRYWITGYDICEACCGKTDGITASGAAAQVGRTAAAGAGVEFGTVLWIPGIGERVIEDRGGLGPKELDVLCVDHTACREIAGWYEVYRVEEAGA